MMHREPVDVRGGVDVAMFARPFYYVRHGETEANVRRVVCGSLDVDLTPSGVTQAHAAARALAGEPITRVYSSPLRRARRTAEAIACVLGVEISIVPELAERSRGTLEGKPASAAAECPDDGETFECFAARVLDGLAQVTTPTPLLVTHLGVLRVLSRRLGIVHAEEPSENALPLRFAPRAEGGWSVERVVAAHREVPR